MEFELKLDIGAKAPEKNTEDVGWDLFAYEPIQFTHGLHYVKIRTGVYVTPPSDYYFRIVPRSSSMEKKGIIIIEGTVDPSYTGEILIQAIKMNWSSLVTERIEKGEKIAQLILTPKISSTIKIVDKLQETKRGNGGFGSTGGYIEQKKEGVKNA